MAKTKTTITRDELEQMNISLNAGYESVEKMPENTNTKFFRHHLNVMHDRVEKLKINAEKREAIAKLHSGEISAKYVLGEKDE